MPVLANVTASEAREPETIRRLLVDAGDGPRALARKRGWRSARLASDTTVEVGGNKVLTGMVKRIDKELQTISLDTPADIEAFAKTL